MNIAPRRLQGHWFICGDDFLDRIMQLEAGCVLRAQHSSEGAGSFLVPLAQ